MAIFDSIKKRFSAVFPSQDKPSNGELSQEEAMNQHTERQAVLQWQSRIRAARTYFEPDFKRMRENMEFAGGLQWNGQETMQSEEYVANWTNRETNQKVASLYAKDPKAVARRRKRLDYQIWDGKIESLQAAHQMVSSSQGQPPTPEVFAAQALVRDFQMGQQWHQMVEKVGQTLETCYQYECDTQTPDFKYQMKQLVRKTVTTGVGYVRLNFVRTGECGKGDLATDESIEMRMKRIRHIIDKIDDGKITEDDAQVIQLQQLAASLGTAQQEMQNVSEHLEFDFPSSTSIIVDPHCKSLKGFIGARWIVQQTILPIEDVNAYYEVDIKTGGKLVEYSDDGTEKVKPASSKEHDLMKKPLCCHWEVFDIIDKSTFILVDGWQDFIVKPAPLSLQLTRFWPIFAITFNDIEVENNCRVHLYPPSDVDLIRHPQKEYNRMRNELRKHRARNRPFYATTEGWLTDKDIEKLNDHDTCELVKFKGLPPNGNLKDNLLPFVAAPIDPSLYDTSSVEKDAMLVIGSQQSNQQPQRHVAATPAVIQEQARISGVNSNVDDLDDLLSELARAGGEIMLREFSLETVRRIVGVGAVWPEQNREDFLNEIYLEVLAASSGRPNKAVDVANFQALAPIMFQMGAQPWPLIKKGVAIMDANIDVDEFAPVIPQQAANQGSPPKPSQQVQPQQVGQQAGGLGHPVPVMAH